MKLTNDQINRILDCVKETEKETFAMLMTEVMGEEGERFQVTVIEQFEDMAHKEKLKDPMKILRTASAVFQVRPEDVLGVSRRRELVDARRMSIAASMMYGAFPTLMRCGKFFNRDHATVCYSKRSHIALVESDPEYRLHYHEFVNLMNV
jgi:chromosomal replication initiation ATPase DnaA